MNIVIAPDSFKGSISAIRATHLITQGIQKVLPEVNCIKFPVADGGEGTVEAMVTANGGIIKQQNVIGPLGKTIKASYGLLNNRVAVVEMAEASGLPLVSENLKNPLITTTYGTGQLIKAALDDGCSNIIIGIGGSATNDGGVGMAQALGISFKDAHGNEIGYGGGAIANLVSIDMSSLDPRIKNTNITVACDVTNPLCGKEGASAVYGPQKGATPKMVTQLDANLKHLANTVKTQLCVEMDNIKGGGAAGGLGAGLMVFCNATLKPGIDTVLDAINIDDHLKNAHLVITGEGKMDSQSMYGKVPVGIATRAKKYNIPVLAIVGSIGALSPTIYESGIDSIISCVNAPMTLEEAIANTDELLIQAAERAMRMIKMGTTIKKKGDVRL